MRTIDNIIIHCSATPNFKAYCAADIDRWHQARGWKMIGYHYVIGLAGGIEKGRPDWMVGAHVKGLNAHSVGICLIGTDEFTPEQMDALTALLKELKNKFKGASVHGHREFNRHKTCPGFDVQQWLKELKL